MVIFNIDNKDEQLEKDVNTLNIEAERSSGLGVDEDNLYVCKSCKRFKHLLGGEMSLEIIKEYEEESRKLNSVQIW